MLKDKSMATKTKDPVKLTQDFVDELLKQMASEAKATVSLDKANDTLIVNIDPADETGLLIGRQGETLLALQSIIGIATKQLLREWKRVAVDIADWREKQEEHLKSLAESTAQRAIETGEDQPLYNLTPAQRRIVHMTLADREEVTTESMGEGPDRYLVIKLK
ncbi:MAG: R3H domain-containing nucleic acid-binding protein [Candidatus Microgenomates bacterium]